MSDLSPAGAPLIAMRGAGYYSDHTAGAKSVIDAATPLVAEALAAMDLAATSSRPFAIADFGAADGGTSLDLMRTIVRTVRAAAPERPITLTYTDLPYNDFSVVFRRLHGMLGSAGATTANAAAPDAEPLGRMPQLFTFASGTSFYRQVFPDDSLSFGFSATAMHWLSRMPGPIADHVQAVGATAEERRPFHAQAMADWETILLARARELVAGGRLVLANFCVDPQGRHLGGTGGVDMFDAFARHWRGLLREGAIGEAEYRAGTLQQFYKTTQDFAAPFAEADAPVRRAGLRLDHLSTRVTPCPYAARFRQERDAAAFAEAYVPTLRSWTESTFFSALDAARPLAERQAIVDRFYAAYRAEVAASPEGHAMDYVHCFMVVSKAG